MTEETIFEIALGKENPAERSAYLDQACGGDPALRQCVELLLEAHANLGNFMEVDAVEQLAAVLPVPASAAGAQANVGASTGSAAAHPDAQRERSGDSDPSTQGPGDLTDWPAGQVILDDFVVERELGQGGMGKVYLVRSRSTGQPFAVKRALLRNEDSRRDFLAELRTWIDLPEHPHLVACRFFRTVGDEIVIFAEFVERGSLAALIQERRLTSLEQILDAAIQFAWGLHAAHELGLVHQDVKPSNALVTGDGLVKVADFGLARARAAALVGEAGARLRPDVTGYGGTPPYKSPEQAAGERLTPATDVWSWGVAILEMFVGEVTWGSGVAAPESLKAFLKRPADPELPAMPNGVAEVLQKCFRRDPAERWASLSEAAEALQRAYRQAASKEYPRPTPAAHDTTRQAAFTHDRRTTTGVQWDDPRECLIKAFQAEGRDPAAVEAFLPPRAGSRKAQAIADLAAYEEARCIFERLVAEGRKNLEPLLAALYTNKARVHENVDDVPGALALYDRAIYIYKRLVVREGRHELANNLAMAYVVKASAMIAIGKNRPAINLCNWAVTIYKRLVEQEGRRELAAGQALAYMTKAIAASALGNKRAAMELYDRAVTIYGRLVEQEGRQELADALAAACVNKAIVVSDMGDKNAAVALYDWAIRIVERLMVREGRRELANDLALICMNKAIAVSALGDNRTAVALFERAIVIRKALVEHEGRRELEDDLARTYMNKAIALRALGDNREAMALYGLAIAIRKHLVEQEGRQELQGDLAWAVALRAKALLDLGDHQRAQSDARIAVPILKAEIARTGRADLQRALTWATKALREVL